MSTLADPPAPPTPIRRERRPRRALTALAGGLLALPAAAFLPAAHPLQARPTASQAAHGADQESWNSPRSLEIAARAVAARRGGLAEGALRRFEARAEGHVFFLGEFAGERQLVRADQVALEVRWQAPDRALQTIVGRRHEEHLPTNIRYHIDHLSVILDNFGDRIRLGEGEEVRDVLHPAAPGALRFYDYRLADSLEIGLRDRDVRVYALEVRPSDPGAPGLVGTVFVERASGAIARLRVTFTSAAYVDPDLDYIGVDLRSGLWEGQHWLPAHQEVEIRRQVRWLSFPVAGIIRTSMRVDDYRLNPEDGFALPAGGRVAVLPGPRLRAYDAWREPLHGSELRQAVRAGETLEELRRRAREMVTPSSLLGGAHLRAHAPDVSSVVRARRAEGVLVGAGGAWRPDHRLELSLWAGYPTGRKRPEVEAALAGEAGEGTFELRAAWNRLADVGPFPGAAGTVSTLGFALRGRDYTDPYFEKGVTLGWSGPVAGGRGHLAADALRQHSAELVADPLGGRAGRPVRPINDGFLAAVRIGWSAGPGEGGARGWRFSGELEAGVHTPITDGVTLVQPEDRGDRGYLRPVAEIEGAWAEGPWRWGGRLGAAVAAGRVPRQRLVLMGGRGTVPGYPFRAWGGDHAAFAALEASREVAAPWLRARAVAAAGWAGARAGFEDAARRFGLEDSGGIRPSVGAGVGLLHDVLRVELVRGLDGGEWEWVVGVRRGFWSVL